MPELSIARGTRVLLWAVVLAACSRESGTPASHPGGDSVAPPSAQSADPAPAAASANVRSIPWSTDTSEVFVLVSDSGRSVPFDFSVEDEGPERICDIRLIASFYELGRSRWQKHGHLRKRCPGDDQPDGRESAGTDSGVYHRRGDTLVFELQDEGKFIELGDRGVLRGDTLRTAFRGAVDRQPVSVYVRRRRGAQ